MTELDSEHSRQLVVPALFSGLVAALLSTALLVSLVQFSPTWVGADGPLLVQVVVHLGTVASNLVWYVPYLLVILVTIVYPTQRTVTACAGGLYGLKVLVTWIPQMALDGGATLALFVVPFADVAEYLGVALVLWLAYHGGYERVTASIGDVPEHPLAVFIDGKHLGDDLPLQRGIGAVALAAIVAATGLVATDLLHGLLRETSTTGQMQFITTAGVPPEQFPLEVLFQASFLLALLLVTGSRMTPRRVLAGVGLILGVQWAVALPVARATEILPANIWAGDGPMLGPMLAPVVDVIVFVAIAVAVWLAFHRGRDSKSTLHGTQNG